MLWIFPQEVDEEEELSSDLLELSDINKAITMINKDMGVKYCSTQYQ